MKKILAFGLTIALAISALAMSGCSFLSGLLGGNKSDFAKAVDGLTNFTLETTSTDYDYGYLCYRFTEDKMELTTYVADESVPPTRYPQIGTKWWDATDTTDYVLLEKSINTNNEVLVKHKTKAEYVSGKKDSLDFIFGCLVQKEEQLEFIQSEDPSENSYYQNKEGQSIVFEYQTTQGLMTMSFFDIKIEYKDGAIVFANYSILTVDPNLTYTMELTLNNVGTPEFTLPAYER